MFCVLGSSQKQGPDARERLAGIRDSGLALAEAETAIDCLPQGDAGVVRRQVTVNQGSEPAPPQLGG